MCVGPEDKCCARSAGLQRPFPNTRRCSPPIATRRALCFIGQCKLFTGAIEETIPLLERAMRLSPHEPRIGIWCQQVGRAHLLQSRCEEAIAWFEKARNDSPAHPIIRAELASAYALNAEIERAAVELAEARRLSADDRFSSLARLRAFTYRGVVPKIRALYEATFFVGLRLAGMPEELTGKGD